MASKKDSNEDDPKSENLNNDSDDSFGLPEIQYEPIRRDEPIEEMQASSSFSEPKEDSQQDESGMHEDYTKEEQPKEPVYEEQHAYMYHREEEETSLWPKILGVVLIILVGLAVAWYLMLYKPKQDEAAAQARIVAEQQAAVQKQKEEAAARIRLEQEAAEKRRLDSLALLNTSAAGTIEILNERTGRYYVVVASAVDSDLLMDYATKLTVNGLSSKIIPPFGRHKVSRLAIAEGDTFAAAAEKSEPLKAEFGDAVWVLKY